MLVTPPKSKEQTTIVCVLSYPDKEGSPRASSDSRPGPRGQAAPVNSEGSVLPVLALLSLSLFAAGTLQQRPE